MSQVKSKAQIADRASKIDMWQERSPVERRTDRDKRNTDRNIYFFKAGKERRTGTERRRPEERRDRWMRVGKWRSEPVFEE
jgi:hypothetical protein